MIFRSGCGAADRAGADRGSGIAGAAIAVDGTVRGAISSATDSMGRHRFRRDRAGRVDQAGVTGDRRGHHRAMGAIGVRRRRMGWGRRRDGPPPEEPI